MAAPSATKRPIIVIKKKGGHGGHHGGAWKVAYADFVTAMMALFIVLWLMNSSKQIQVAVGGYFKDPTGTSKKVGTNENGLGREFFTDQRQHAQAEGGVAEGRPQVTNFDKLKNQIQMTVTAEGLRIELMESSTGTFFESGKPGLNGDGKELLIALAQELAKLPNTVSIEGHTDAKPSTGNRDYGNWELSADRANTARRLMQLNGVRPNQVSQVRGYADQKLRTPNNPLDPSNRRITLIVQYITKDEDAAPAAPPAKENPASESAEPAPHP